MCLIVFAWQPGHALPLLVAANRDEFYARPSLPLAAWEDAEGVFAGRDLEAGGTWLGLGPAGRFAALTNVRDPSQALGKRSRGELVADFLRGGGNPADYLAQVAGRAADYSGFNLLIGDRHQLWHYNPRVGPPRLLPAGIYGLSNAALDTPCSRLAPPSPSGLPSRIRRPCWSCWPTQRRPPTASCRIPAWVWPRNACSPACSSPARATALAPAASYGYTPTARGR